MFQRLVQPLGQRHGRCCKSGAVLPTSKRSSKFGSPGASFQLRKTQSLTAALARVRSSSSRSSATNAGTAGRRAGYRLALWKPAQVMVEGSHVCRAIPCCSCTLLRLHMQLMEQQLPCQTNLPTCVADGEASKLAGSAVRVSAQLNERRHHAMLRQVTIEAVAAQQWWPGQCQRAGEQVGASGPACWVEECGSNVNWDPAQ